MTREQHLAYCSVCNNQKFDIQQGIVCSLTNQVADFETTCDSFDENPAYKQEWQTKQQAQDVLNRSASLNTRFANGVIDALVIVLLAGGIIWLVKSVVSPYTWYRIPVMYFYVGYFSLQVGYYTLLEAWMGKTVAKMLTKTKVTNYQGQKPHVLLLLLRSLIRLIPFEPFSFLNNDASGWHDRASQTVVIYDKA